MKHPQCRITILHRIGDDAHCDQVINLVERNLLATQLLENGVGTLDAPVDARRNALAPQFRIHGVADLFQDLLARVALDFDRCQQQLTVCVSFQVLERQVFEFAADFAHTEAVGDGAYPSSVSGVADASSPPLRRIHKPERAHIVDAVRQLRP